MRNEHVDPHSEHYASYYNIILVSKLILI